VGTVLFAAASAGDRALFDALKLKALKEEQPEKRGMLIAALGSFREPALVREALGLMVDGTFQSRDSRGLLFSAMSWRGTRAMAYAFMKENFDKLAGGTSAESSQFLFRVPGFFCDRAMRDDAQAFFSPRASRVDGAPLMLARSLERVDLCISAWERDQADITAFLRRY
jgi:hypothetical protein